VGLLNTGPWPDLDLCESLQVVNIGADNTMAPSKVDSPPRPAISTAVNGTKPHPQFKSLDGSLMAATNTAAATTLPYDAKPGITFAHQESLPKLPIASLEDVCRKYLEAVRPLQTKREHAETVAAVREFLKTDGPELQERLKKYAGTKSSYIEQFCKSKRPWPCEKYSKC
jgi:carnitine O-acetyltransferase